MAEKIQTSFYLLKDRITFFNKKTQKIVEESIDIKFLDKYFKTKGYKEQNVLSDLSKDYEIKLYYKKTPTIPKWKEFVKSIASEDQDVLKTNRAFSESYLVVLKNKKSNNYFVTTGGYGHVSVQEVTTTDFGLQVLSRLIKAEDKALKSTKERSLTGGVQGAIKFFRNDYNFYDNENFGNVYNELNATIDKKQLVEIFGFSQHDINSNSLCIVKDSFSLKKSINFEELLRIIEKCEILLAKPPIVEINSAERIPKQSKVLIGKLYNQLYSHIYGNYIDIAKFFSVEISHREFEKYYYSHKTILDITIRRKRYKIEFDGPVRNMQVILNEIRGINGELSEEEFNNIIEKSYLETYDENGMPLTEDSLKNHFCAEILLDKLSYFLIEKDWYKIKESFLNRINEQASYFVLNNKYLGEELRTWSADNLSENEYNASYIGDKNSLVFDKFTPQNIEACDILKWDDKNIYFYHVKKGFDNSMRDLCNQVFISARKIQEDLRTGYSFLKQLYTDILNNDGKTDYSKKAKKQFEKLSQEQFIQLFDKKEIIFVLAVLDTAKTDRSITQDITKFDSNIAKFSLNELAKNMRNLDVKFQILQLQK